VARFPVEVERFGLLGTRVLIRIDESVVPRGSISEMMSDLDFVGKPYETSSE